MEQVQTEWRFETERTVEKVKAPLRGVSVANLCLSVYTRLDVSGARD